uniref:F-box domain-containing protein n=1 Tax=Meloidogyne enterolobii TaxID=390850 RepID=A0A6V7X5D1_MELEN|nr:unnamed protein product [Meloidogyne enterolobii]
MQLQDLPPEILKYIFDFLTFNEKIKIERVCKEWKDLCWNFAWLDFDKRRPSRTLGIFSALIRRSAPYLELLCIERGIKVSTRLGRYFHYLTPSLQHFSMEEPIDVWHLNQIEEFLAPNLLSLGLVLNKKKETLDAFLSLILKCQKLECLRINRIKKIYERSLEINQKQFLPSTLQQLFVFDYSNLELRNPLSFHLLSEYALKLLKNLNALETFTCTLDRFNELNEFVEENEFFQKLDKILKENENKLNASFRFLYQNYLRRSDTIFKWRKGYLFEVIKVAKPDPFKDFIFGNSIVLKEIMNETFGKKKRL